MNPASRATPADALLVVCLCAAWCRTCEAYASVFQTVTDALRAQWPGLKARWIDIEDEADLLGDFDVETFPTVLLVDTSHVRFAGVLTPQPETLMRVLRAALRNDALTAPQAPEIEALARRLRATFHDQPEDAP
jgi:thioredoxin-like negative regulator of GroEL